MSPTPHRDGYGQKAMAIPTASANVSRANTPNDDVDLGSAGAGAAARAPGFAELLACFSGATGMSASSGSDASCLSILASSFSQSRSGIRSRSLS